jgi:acetyltransferase-like isoleucine patch superfamily enzyme
MNAPKPFPADIPHPHPIKFVPHPMKFFFLFDFRFYQFLLLNIEGFLRHLIGQYRKRRSYPVRLKHLEWRTDLALDAPERLHISSTASIGRNVIIAVPPDLSATDPAKVVIGDHAFLGTGVELGLTPGAVLSIGDHTSMHRGTVILGNVQIGRNCIFSYNIFIASGNHVINAKPTWLIHDQDNHFLAVQPQESVVIDDDVWLGWGIFIKSGVHIGRGAILGANAVVIRDIEPYSICAGTPAQLIGRRLVFSPPSAIHAGSDDDLPYFYSGFRDDQTSLAESRASSVIWTGHESRIVLRLDNASSLTIRGNLTAVDSSAFLFVSLYVNQRPLGQLEIAPGAFERTFALSAEQTAPPAAGPQFFDGCLQISLLYPQDAPGVLGISEARLTASDPAA